MKKQGFALVAALGLACACGQKEPAEGPTAHPTPEPLTVSPPSPPPPEPQPSGEPPTATSAEPAVSEPGLHDLCSKVCTKVAEKCSASVAENCNINCDQYDKTHVACQKVTREALICSEAAKDLPCANVAPESCNKAFQRMASCQRAPESFAEQAAPAAKGLPTGWERLEPASGEFVAVMPAGVQIVAGVDERAWVANSGGLAYQIRRLPAPSEKFTNKSQVRLATAWLAPCTLKLKLHGQVEKGDETSVHFDAACKDGSERHGMIRITQSHLFILSVAGPAGERGELETFVYGFDPR